MSRETQVKNVFDFNKVNKVPNKVAIEMLRHLATFSENALVYITTGSIGDDIYFGYYGEKDIITSCKKFEVILT